ncbi:MAG TPA: HAD hydrolase-like protein, partial [Actinomycetales bacterium]|nr:HAD hydrolase-like protein [Actinomycetales bacterium]
MDYDGVDAVLFDLDGVITPTAEKHMQAWNRMFTTYFTERGIDPYSDEDYFRYIDGKPRVEGIASMLAARGLELPAGGDDDTADADTVTGLGLRKNDVFLELLAEGIEAYPGSVRYLDALEAADIASCVVSSSKNATTVLEAAGLRERFDVVVDGVVAAREGLAGKPR